ncbi:MAG TPA: CUAEP/CCAEP-tail radical SAM protein [Acidimicrobiales bacterium]|nr:CUAEP/CCAEP-tail radical SAM protein [Acidimicrobiales bacterium]
MRVLLLSTYELGTQPLGCAVPAAALSAAGHEVRSRDLSVEEWPADDVAWADAAACSVPMHTALRLGLAAVTRLHAERPGLPVALHGLYAPIAATTGLLGPRDLAAAGESDELLLAWLDGLGSPPPDPDAAGPAVRVELGRAPVTGGRSSPLPRREGLPGLDRYAKLALGGEERLVGSVETTRGCSHTCRHCPVPVVYRGRTRVVPAASVLDDVEQLVAAGARHVHFADPDFLNRPRHALEIVRALHGRHLDLTFDATIKVTHLLRHRALVPELAAAGCLFVVSAFESASDDVLARLDKGHRAAQCAEAVEILRSSGIEPRPSFLPFTPWTSLEDLAAILDLVGAYDLVWNVDPVQYGIRLLLPPGSLLLEEPDEVLAGCLGAYDPAQLGFGWRSPDPRLDELHQVLAGRTELAAASGEPAEQTYRAVRALVFAAIGRADPGPGPLRSAGAVPGPERPRLTETWFCCAEPTTAQLGQIAALDGSPVPGEPVVLGVARRAGSRSPAGS